MQDFSKAIELKPTNPKSYCSRGTLELAIKDHAGAVIDYNKTIELEPKYAKAYKQLGTGFELSLITSNPQESPQSNLSDLGGVTQLRFRLSKHGQRFLVAGLD